MSYYHCDYDLADMTASTALTQGKGAHSKAVVGEFMRGFLWFVHNLAGMYGIFKPTLDSCICNADGKIRAQ